MNAFTVLSSKPGTAKLKDGTIILLRIAIAGVRYAGFTPFGGIGFNVKVIGGVSTLHVPDNLKKQVEDKPAALPGQPPTDGWEFIEIEEQQPAVEEVKVKINNREYVVRAEGEASMVSRNMNYKTEFGEPLYWVSWVNKITWKPLQQG